jgi:hypothetical protein
MTLDNEQQRQFLLEMFKQVNFPGQIIDLAVEIKAAITVAKIEKQNI